MAKILVHIGFPKTASTTLQQSYFQTLNLEGKINFLNFDSKLDVKPNSYFLYDFYKNRDFSIKEKILNRLSDTQTNVISNESVSTSLFWFTKNSDTNLEFIIQHQKSFPEDLFNLLDGNKNEIYILLTIRNQSDLLYSIYVQRYGYGIINNNHPKKIQKFYFNNKKQFKSKNFREFFYDEFIFDYIKIFSKRKIIINLFEDLARKNKDFCLPLTNFLDTDLLKMKNLVFDNNFNRKLKSNKGYKTNSLKIRSTIKLITNLRKRLTLVDSLISRIKENSIYQKYKTKILHRKISKNIPYFSSEEKANIFNTFKKSNEFIAEEFSLDVGKMKKYEYL